MIVPLVKIKIPHLDPLGVRTNSILLTISSHDTRNKGWTVIETLVVIFFLVDRVIKKINPLGLSFVQYNVLINVTYYIYNTRSLCRGRRGRDRMVVGFTTTFAISAYHHWCYEFESRSGRGVQHYVIKFVSDLRQVGGFLWVLRFPSLIKLTAMI